MTLAVTMSTFATIPKTHAYSLISQPLNMQTSVPQMAGSGLPGCCIHLKNIPVKEKKSDIWFSIQNKVWKSSCSSSTEFKEKQNSLILHFKKNPKLDKLKEEINTTALTYSTSPPESSLKAPVWVEMSNSVFLNSPPGIVYQKQHRHCCPTLGGKKTPQKHLRLPTSKHNKWKEWNSLWEEHEWCQTTKGEAAAELAITGEKISPPPPSPTLSTHNLLFLYSNVLPASINTSSTQTICRSSHIHSLLHVSLLGFFSFLYQSHPSSPLPLIICSSPF